MMGLLLTQEHAVNALVPHPTCPDGSVLGRMGTLEVRLAQSQSEIVALQELRGRIFKTDMAASENAEILDADHFDQSCDHLIVVDQSIKGPQKNRIVGTYRLMRSEQARLCGGFYSAQEFAIGGLLQRKPDRKFLELGRSCVLEPYRSKRTIELLWQGIWAYCLMHDADVMMGCASFPGTIPEAHSEALSFLYHFARAEGDWAINPLPGQHREMDLMPPEAIDVRNALNRMPPLIKGYLRVGAKFGTGAVVDHAFGTTDVFVLLPIENISLRYRNYYGNDASRFAG